MRRGRRPWSRRWRVAAALLVVGATSLAIALVVLQNVSGRRTGPVVGSSSASGRGSPGSGADQRQIDACITTLAAGLPLDRRVGQLLMLGAPVDSPRSAGDIVTRYGLGGLFLAGRSTQPASRHRQAIERLQQAMASTGVRPHIAVDQEGGQVQTLQGADFPPIPSATEQGTWSQATLRSRTASWARQLAGIGVTMDLAPVADTVPAGAADRNPPIGAFARQYGGDPDAVAQDVATVVAAIQAQGVLATLKHFPGLGRVTANPDTSDRAVDALASPDDPFLKPFVAGIEAGAAAVMISSARYPRLDRENVAALSAPVITGLLRQRMGYSGLVISDDFGAAAALGAVTVGERAVRFVGAGGDMILTVRSSDVGPMLTALVDAARASPAFQERITDAARHVLRSKHRAGLVACPAGR